MPATPHRIITLDAAKGLFSLLMVMSNFATLGFIFTQPYNPQPEWWEWLAKLILVGFLILSGVSIQLLYRKESNPRARRNSFLRRSIIIFAAAMVLQLANNVLMPEWTLSFGVLHVIALTGLLAFGLIPFPRASLMIGIATILSGVFSLVRNIPHRAWMEFVIGPVLRNAWDYTPLLPWAGFIFLGVWISSRFSLKDWMALDSWSHSHIVLKKISGLGRHSLFIFVFHQLLIFIIYWWISGSR